MTADSSRELVVGQTLGRYRIDAELGQGGMGQVFRAFDTLMHRAVALKVLRPPPAEPVSEGAQTTGRTRAIERLLREARAAASLTHPNVVAVYDIGSQDGVHYLALELVEGRTLRALEEAGPIPLEQKQAWLVDLARALAAAHHAGLVHRDIKPENVMIRRDGTLKVLDFGLARTGPQPTEPAAPGASPATPLPTLTAEGVVVGTPLYMSPEQLLARRVDGRADQWAWAVLAWELLSGALPWAHVETTVGLVAHILTQDPGSLRDRAPAVSEVWDRVITRALSKDREARFASMDELLAALEAGPSQLAPALASPPAPAPPGPSAALATPAALPTPAPLSTLEPSATPVRPATRSRAPLVLGVAAIALVAGLAATLGASRWLRRRPAAPAAHAVRAEVRGLVGAGDASAPELPRSPLAAAPAGPCSGDGCAVVELAAGGDATCARLASGAVYCWGRCSNGVLGDGTLDSRARPARVDGLEATRLSMGTDHVCAITRDRQLRCWGENRYGAIADAAPIDEIARRPAPVTLPEPTIDVAAGRFHTCALGVSGAVRCWGLNEHLELGDPSRGTFDAAPAAVPGTSGALAIDTTASHTCALRVQGAERVVTCWGVNDEAQLGAGEETEAGRPAVDALRGPDLVEVAVGSSHTCVRRSDGAVDCWGAGCAGETGDPSLVHPTLAPRRVAALGVASRLDAGNGFSCAIVELGAVRCWGVNAQNASQLGAGSDVQLSAAPLAVRGLAGAIALSVGEQHACASTATHGVSCWGANGDGQLGNGAPTPAEAAPVAVVGLPR